MRVKINIKELPIFKYVPKKLMRKLSPIFKIMNIEEGALIVKKGDPIPGYCIIIQGEVNLLDEDIESPIEVLGQGQSFGEISLISEEHSLISIRTQGPCIVVCLMRDKFHKFVKNNPDFALLFYRGALERMDQRFLITNKQIEMTTSMLKSEIFHMLKGDRIDERLVETQDAVNKTGVQMFKSLSELIPKIQELTKEFPHLENRLSPLKNEIQNVLLVDSQNFDLISQQISIVYKYLTNIQKFLLEQKLNTIHGDFNITTLTSRESQNGEDVEFF